MREKITIKNIGDFVKKKNSFIYRCIKKLNYMK